MFAIVGQVWGRAGGESVLDITWETSGKSPLFQSGVDVVQL